MAFVVCVLESFEQFGVAPGAAAVFGRTATADFEEARVEHTGFGVDEPLDFDPVLPAVAEVVEIDEPLRPDVFENVGEASLAGIEEVAGPVFFGIGGAPADIAGTQLIEMAVGPSHGGLDGQVQPVEPDIERHFEAPQHHGLDVVESDLETGDAGSAHAATLRRSISAAQFHGKSWSSLWMT